MPTSTAPHAARSAESGLAAAVVGTVALATLAAGAAGAAAGHEVAVVAHDAPATGAVRTVLVVGGLVAGAWLVARRHVLDVGRGRLRAAVTVGAAVGYLLDPFAWSGSAVVAGELVGPAAAAWALDLVVWCAVACAVAVLATRRAGDRAVSYGPSVADGDVRPHVRGRAR